jgi:hypothetical protein
MGIGFCLLFCLWILLGAYLTYRQEFEGRGVWVVVVVLVIIQVVIFYVPLHD